MAQKSKEVISGVPKSDSERVLVLMATLAVLAEAFRAAGFLKCPVCKGSGTAHLDLGEFFVYSGPCPLAFVLPHGGALN